MKKILVVIIILLLISVCVGCVDKWEFGDRPPQTNTNTNNYWFVPWYLN
jgi:uncharacterized protein YxeA